MFFVAVVGIRPGLTSELRQRVHGISELTPKERDYRLLVTEDNLIAYGLLGMSSGKSFPLSIVVSSSHIAS